MAIKRKSNKKFLLKVMMFIFTIVCIYFLYSLSLLNGIENVLRIIITIVIFIMWLLLFIKGMNRLNNRKKSSKLIFTMFFISIILGFIGFNIAKTYSSIDKMSTSDNVYSSSIVTLKDSDADTIDDLAKEKIGMLSDQNNIEGNELPSEIIKKEKLKNKIVYYDSFISLIKGLYDGEVNFIFLPTNYGVMFSSIEGYESLESDTKIIYKYEKKKKIETSRKNGKLTDPFTVLVMGVDSEKENIKDSTFNGDALMLITFNPKTLSTTILSIPRDTYVPIACFSNNRKNKITHAAWYGEDCMIKTIENLVDIKIDYYLKINFKGVVNLVDALGGIEVDVPFSFCEQNSDRLWGNNTVYVEKGLRNLNGEQVLALARNRHPNPSMCSSKWTNYTSNDFIRGQNQQLIIKGMINKAKSIRSLDTVYDLLDTVANSMETNMSTSEILSLYNIGKDILINYSKNDASELINMKRLYISGYDAYIYDYSTISNQGTGLRLYNFVAYDGSIKDISNAMKINLGLKKEKVIKKFSFSVDDPYVETVIGRGNYNESGIALLPNFVGKDKSVATNYGSKYGLKINVEYTDSTSKKDLIISQSVSADTDVSEINSSKGITIKVSNGSKNNTTKEEVDCSLKKNRDDKDCKVPNFVNKKYSNFTYWYKYNKQYDIDYDDSSCKNSADIVISQTGVNSGSSIYDWINDKKKLTITCSSDNEKDKDVDDTEDKNDDTTAKTDDTVKEDNSKEE